MIDSTFVSYLKKRAVFYSMLSAFRFALDGLFLFMLVVSLSLFGVNYFIPIDHHVVEAVEAIDFVVLGGYYFFFIHGLATAQKKLVYIRQHWLMLVLLIIPFVPLARIFRLHTLERVFGIGANTLWHILDELKLL